MLNKILNKIPATLVFLVFLIPTTLYAESDLQIFQTQQPGQVLLSTIEPLYGNSAKISARNNTLIVKAPRHILLEIEQLLKEIDKPLHNLLIEVASSLDGQGHYQQDSIEGRIKIGDDTVIRSRAPKQHSPGTTIRYKKDGSVIKTTHTRQSISRSNPNNFKVRAVEGTWSQIQIGRKVPYYSSSYRTPYGRKNSVELVDVSSGFEVYPTLNDNHVTLKVRPYNSSLNRANPGQINIRSVDTIITGKVGQWIYLGGVINQINEQNSGFIHSSKRRSELDTGYRIKVNIID